MFVTASIEGLHLIREFLTHPVALTAMILATISHAVLWKLFYISRAWRLRLLTGFQLLMVIVAWMAIIFPEALVYADGTALSFFDALAPAKTLVMLGWALIIGVFIFLPLLVYLFFVFKKT